MMNSIKTAAGVSDRTPDRREPSKEEGAQNAPAAHEPQAESPAGADVRLVIERDAEGVEYVYRLVDRATGKVVAEYSREQVADLAQGPDYRAGSVVSTKA